MSQDDWERFDSLVRSVASHSPSSTLARAHGEVISGLMDTADHSRREPAPLDWMDWERQKTLKLLRVRSAM
jgi:hypothetical protein